MFSASDLNTKICALNQLPAQQQPSARPQSGYWMTFPELKREGMGPERGWDTYSQPHSKWWKEIGAPDFVVTENFCAHRLGSEGWVESGLKPLRAVVMEQRGS